MQDINNEVENGKAMDYVRRESVSYYPGEGRQSEQDIHKRMADSYQDDEQMLQQSTCKIDHRDEAEVKVSGKYSSSRVTITIKAARVLDLRAVNLIRNVDEFVRSYKTVRVIVDLGRTLRIQDSGLAMLLLLKNKLGKKIEKIKLINARRLHHRQLNYLPAIFEIN